MGTSRDEREGCPAPTSESLRALVPKVDLVLDVRVSRAIALVDGPTRSGGALTKVERVRYGTEAATEIAVWSDLASGELTSGDFVLMLARHPGTYDLEGRELRGYDVVSGAAFALEGTQIVRVCRDSRSPQAPVDVLDRVLSG